MCENQDFAEQVGQDKPVKEAVQAHVAKYGSYEDPESTPHVLDAKGGASTVLPFLTVKRGG